MQKRRTRASTETMPTQNTAQHQISGRVIGRISVTPWEGPRGYLRRVARWWRYSSLLFILALANVRWKDIDSDGSSQRLAATLRLSISEWESIAYRRADPHKIWFSNHLISCRHLTYRYPRLCIECLRERYIEKCTWELDSLTVCPIHGSYLVDRCPRCGDRLSPECADVHVCRCGYDILASTPTEADLASTLLCSLIESNIYSNCQRSIDLATLGFPRELFDLTLEELLRLVRILGNYNIDGQLTHKLLRLKRTDPNAAQHATRDAAWVLTNWPDNFHLMLQHTQSKALESNTISGALTTFGGFYACLYDNLPDVHFNFLRDNFEQFMKAAWIGETRAHPRWLRGRLSRHDLEWCPLGDAISILGRTRLKQLIEQGKVRGVIREKRGRSNGRISKTSLDQWKSKGKTSLNQRKIKDPSAENRMEIARRLDLSPKTVMRIAQTGMIRRSSEGVHAFVREDALDIFRAFERNPVPEVSHCKTGSEIPLRRAMHDLLKPVERLTSFFLSILDGRIAPVARIAGSSGIGGYVFSRLELLIASRVKSKEDLGGGTYLSANNAAKFLSVCGYVITALINAGHLVGISTQTLKQYSEFLIPFDTLQVFDRRYVSLGALARRLEVPAKSLWFDLREKAVPFLSVPLNAGRGNALFVPREIADQIREPLARLNEPDIQQQATLQASKEDQNARPKLIHRCKKITVQG
jgi:hypothetical protein